MTSNDATLTRTEAAEILGVSVATVDRYAAEKTLTRRKNGITGRVTFSAREVEDLRLKRASQS